MKESIYGTIKESQYERIIKLMNKESIRIRINDERMIEIID